MLHQKNLSVTEKQILYLSYDGLTDPLGQSQILPYIKGLSNHGYRFTIISFEKPERFRKSRELIQRLADESNINWVPLSFTVNPPLVSKFYDAVRMRAKAVSLHKKLGFHMVHCRSYIAADVGLYMKKRFGIKFFFDMRGFWADEKRDGGHWRDNHPVTGRVYRYYKEREKAYLQSADYVISLTEAGKKEILTWPFYNKAIPMQVIPCCADTTLFSVTDPAQKAEGRRKLGIANGRLVFSYLGSVGMWYMLNEMLLLFKQAKQRYPNAYFLFITHSNPAIIRSKAKELHLSEEDIGVMELPRKEVPIAIKASDINISFIKPVYSKISSSPTKLGEVLSMGIPVIVNSGVGDVEQTVSDAEAGYILHGFSENELEGAINAIPQLLQKSSTAIRASSCELYSLDRGVGLYAACYHTVLS